MPRHGSVANLPDACFALAPELDSLALPAERTADCSACPMVCQPGEPDPPERTVFDPQLRCCTYNPVLPNYLVGRILRRGGPGAAQVRARLAQLDGVSRWAIRPPEQFYDRVAETPLGGGFGRDTARRCPYWVPGLTCSIWQDRDAVCRAWFCKYDDGWKGRELWLALRDLLRIVQVKLCRLVGEEGPHPDRETASVEDWCAWYVQCADRLDAAPVAAVAALEDDGLAEARQRMVAAWEVLRNDALPEVLGPAVTAFYPRGEHVVLEGFSHYSPSTWPMAVFELFALMDGTVGWREALTRVEGFTEADIRELYRLGILEPRVPEDLVPGVRLRGVPAHRVRGLDQEMVLFEWPADLDEG